MRSCHKLMVLSVEEHAQCRSSKPHIQNLKKMHRNQLIREMLLKLFICIKRISITHPFLPSNPSNPSNPSKPSRSRLVFISRYHHQIDAFPTLALSNLSPPNHSFLVYAPAILIMALHLPRRIYPVLQFFLGTLFEFDLREKARAKQTWSSPKHPVHRRTGLGQNLKPAIRVMEFLNKKDRQREARSPNWFECTLLGICWGKGKDWILGGGGSVERSVCARLLFQETRLSGFTYVDACTLIEFGVECRQ